MNAKPKTELNISVFMQKRISVNRALIATKKYQNWIAYQSTRTDFVREQQQLHLLTPKFKEICDCRQRKFSQAEIQNKTKPPNFSETQVTISPVVHSRNGF